METRMEMKILLLFFVLGSVHSFHLGGITMQNPEETDGLLEGDIVPNWLAGRSGIINPAAWWPHGLIYFTYEDGHPETSMVEAAMSHISMTENCIQFRRRHNETNYIKITFSSTGCWSYVGMVGGEQQVSLPSECLSYGFGIGVHELIHVIGFYHEQSRSDRDDYVSIHFENVLPGKQNNFKKYDSDQVSNFSVPYDFSSIMNYSAFAFSKNGRPTIVPKIPGTFIGQRVEMSPKDVQKVRTMYKCE